MSILHRVGKNDKNDKNELSINKAGDYIEDEILYKIEIYSITKLNHSLFLKYNISQISSFLSKNCINSSNIFFVM